MKYKLCSENELNIIKTFECGQCFRWNADIDGNYLGVVGGYAAKVETVNGEVYITSDAPIEFWNAYFDIGRDYAEISKAFTGEYMEKCIEFGMGIRILKQDSWEALCSFIISQCNNIGRIKGIVERLCSSFGEAFEYEGSVYYSFPSAETLSKLTPEELAPIRSGYRAEYIIAAANAVVNGDLDLKKLEECDYRSAIKALRAVKGIGEKVANCVVLFGLKHMEAFPIDVWMKKALRENFPPDFDPESFGSYAGLAQQYIFYYARSMCKQRA